MRSRRGERGATLSEYALLASLVVVASIGSIVFLERRSGSFLVETGSDIGTPRELAADIDPNLPDPPLWLSVPPPPTTTTTMATTVPTTAAPTTAAPTTAAPTTAGPTTTRPPTTVAPTTAAPTTTTVSYPSGALIGEGYLHSRQSFFRCFDATSPGVTGSAIKASFCASAASQHVRAVGTTSIMAFQFTNAANAGLCFSISGSNVVLAPCNGQPWQLFNVTANGSYYKLESRLTPGKCLESRSNGLSLRNCSSSNQEQQWTI